MHFFFLDINILCIYANRDSNSENFAYLILRQYSSGFPPSVIVFELQMYNWIAIPVSWLWSYECCTRCSFFYHHVIHFIESCTTLAKRPAFAS
jgi:hypothetical protein